MKVAGIATDLTLDPLKTHGFNFVAPVIEKDGMYYIHRHNDETFYTLTDMLDQYADDEEDFYEIVAHFMEMTGKTYDEIGSMHNRKYRFVEYEPEFGDIECLKKVDETFHIQPDLEVNPEKLIMGISFDDDIYIGSQTYITQQLELLVGETLTIEEIDILYRVYGMSGQFDKMAEMIDKALNSPLNMMDYIDWQHRKNHYHMEVKLEQLVNANKGKKKELISEEE